MVEVRPPPRGRFPKGSLDIGTDVPESQVRGQINRDLSKVPMFRCDGLECHGDPFDILRFGTKSYVPKFFRFREVERGWLRPDWVTGLSH